MVPPLLAPLYYYSAQPIATPGLVSLNLSVDAINATQ